MGHNISLIPYGAPEKVTCPHCQEDVSTWFDDFDIDSSDPTESVEMFCEFCEKHFHITLNFKVETIVSK